MVSAKDKRLVYASDRRQQAATTVKMSAKLARAVAGSFVTDQFLRAGVPVDTPLLDKLAPLVPKGTLSSAATLLAQIEATKLN